MTENVTKVLDEMNNLVKDSIIFRSACVQSDPALDSASSSNPTI